MGAPRPDAVITTYDYLAFGVLEALSEADCEDVAVVGFNNTRGVVTNLRPFLPLM